jgi:co-chaperonin GroES (HSP10)
MLQAINDKVVVEIISQKDLEQKQLEEKMKGVGLLMPSTDKVDPNKQYGPPVMGVVYSMGPKAIEKFKDNIVVGDRVVFVEKSPHGFEYEGKKLLGLQMDQIIARLERDK